MLKIKFLFVALILLPASAWGASGDYPNLFRSSSFNQETGQLCPICKTPMIRHTGQCAVLHSPVDRCDYNDPFCPNENNHSKYLKSPQEYTKANDGAAPTFIILWVSTYPIFDNQGNHVGDEWIDRQSIRSTLFGIEKWMQILKKHGKGFNFRIYEAYLYKEYFIKQSLEEAEDREKRSVPYK